MDIYDVTIIGGGPAGLFNAFYSGMRDMKTKIIEFQPHLGGKVNFFLEKVLWDVGGQPPIIASKFLDNLVAQAMTFQPTICLNQKVEHIDKTEECFMITTNTGEKHYSKTVIIAIGGGIFKPIKLELNGADQFEGQNLYYTVNGIDKFKDKHVLISGGGNSSIDWAVELLPFAKKITVIYRSNELKAHEAQIKKLVSHGVEMKLNTEITKLIPSKDSKTIERVLLRENDVEDEIAVDEILVCHGYHREVSLDFGSTITPAQNENKQFISEGQCKTTIPGMYAVGDIVAYEDKVYLLVGAFNDAILAVNSAKKYLEPDATDYAMVSSHNDKFSERNRAVLMSN